ncbi:MAG: hypothetical protein ABIO44_00715, partial [Saprospiraceae bacterium]
MQKKALFFILYLCLNSIWSRSASNQMCSRSGDSLILVKIYQSTDGPNWISKWSLNQNMNTWIGVALNQTGCVVQLNLSNNGLKGTIPAEIGGLGSLSRLFLFTNNLSGQIPISIGSLTELTELNFEGNFLTGPIPSNIGNLNKLTLLSLSNNALVSTIPNGIFNLVNLNRLEVNRNNLFGSISPAISNLQKLQILDLSENNFSGEIPYSLGTMISLRDLLLNDNNLTGEPPASMSSLINITSLWLQDNEFTGRVPDLTNSPLLSLRIENNFFNSIPDYSVVTTWGRSEPLGLIMYNNYFTFEDLIPLLSLPRFANWNFKPQRPIVVDSIQFVQYGSNYAIRLNTDPGISDNNYKWLKDTATLNITNQNFFQIIQLEEDEEGYYHGSIINQLIPDFKIDIPYIRIVGFYPAKCDSPLAGKNCSQAPTFCNTSDLNNYCGNLSVSDQNVRAALCNTVNNLDNPRYLRFTASSDSILLEIFLMSCNVVKKDE